ncbi:MAG: immunoglobulin domain-containing protein, partial [Flavobacterium sp.]
MSVSDPVALNTVCDDDPVSLSILATGGSLTYQWYKGGIPVVNGGNISGANTDTLNFVPIHVSDSAASYYCVVTNSCTSVTSGIAKVIVNLKPKIPTQATSACTGLAFSVSPVDGVPTAATIVPAGTTYSWPAPIVTGGMTGGASGSSQTAIDGTLINPTNTAQTATYTVTPVSGTTGNCVGNAFLVTVTVNPAPSIGNQVGSACSGNAFTFAPVNGAGNIIPAGTTYTWGIPTVTGGITGATALSNQPSFIQTLINPTNAVQTATYTITATSGTCVGSTFTMVLSVNPKPTVAADLTSQNICSGFAIAPITLTNPNGVPGTTSYSWTRSNTTNIIGPISGSGNTVNLTLTNTTGVQQTTVFTFYATSEEGCVSVAGTASVTVDPSPIVTAIAAQSVCSGSSIATVNFASSVVGATFTWTRTDNTSLSGIPLSGNGNSLSGTFVNSTNTPQSTTFTVSATSGSCSVAANSATFTVTVKPIPLASASPSTQTVCAGSPILITASDNNNVSGTVFSFSQNNTVSGDNMSISGNLITGSLVNNTTVDRTVIFTINATAAGCPSSTTVSVTVSPNPVINATPATQNVCSGAPITTINLPAIAGVVYSWTRTNGTALGNLTGMPDSDSNATSITGTLTNNTASNQSTTFTITATLGGCTKTASVTVNVFAPMSGSVGISADQVVCPGGTPAALFVSTPPTGGSGAYTYQWQSSTVSNTGPWVNIGTGSTYQPPTTTAGTLDTYYRLIITGCQSFTSNVIKIEVPIFG